MLAQSICSKSAFTECVCAVVWMETLLPLLCGARERSGTSLALSYTDLAMLDRLVTPRTHWALNLCHKFGRATLHVRSRQNTKTNAPQGYGGSGATQAATKWPGRLSPETWVPAQPMSNRPSGCPHAREVDPPP